MSEELEEQQRITYELKDKLRSLEADRVCITEQIKILEAKLLVQELLGKIKVATEENDRLQAKKQELERRLESHQEILTSKEQVQVQALMNREESQREFF